MTWLRIEVSTIFFQVTPKSEEINILTGLIAIMYRPSLDPEIAVKSPTPQSNSVKVNSLNVPTASADVEASEENGMKDAATKIATLANLLLHMLTQ